MPVSRLAYGGSSRMVASGCGRRRLGRRRRPRPESSILRTRASSWALQAEFDRARSDRRTLPERPRGLQASDCSGSLLTTNPGPEIYVRKVIEWAERRGGPFIAADIIAELAHIEPAILRRAVKLLVRIGLLEAAPGESG